VRGRRESEARLVCDCLLGRIAFARKAGPRGHGYDWQSPEATVDRICIEHVHGRPPFS
jgi:hypothetical protein